MGFTTYRAMLVTVAFLTVSVATGVAGQDANSVQMHLQRARAAIEANDPKTARAELKKSKEGESRKLEYSYLMARLAEQEGNLLDAGEFVRSVLRIQREYPEANALLTRLLFYEGRTEEAIKESEITLRIDPANAEAHMLRGDIHLHASEYAEAITAYETTLGLLPKDSARAGAVRQKLEISRWLKQQKDRKSDPSVTSLVSRNKPTPYYTRRAEEARVEGIVVVVARADETGTIAEVIFLKRLGYGFDENAERAVRKLKITPGRIDGKPVSSWLRINIGFNIRTEKH